MRTGDPDGDLAERGIALAIVLEALFEHDDGMRFAGPFAHQPSAGFEHDAGIEGFGALTVGTNRSRSAGVTSSSMSLKK